MAPIRSFYPRPSFRTPEIKAPSTWTYCWYGSNLESISEWICESFWSRILWRSSILLVAMSFIFWRFYYNLSLVSARHYGYSRLSHSSYSVSKEVISNSILSLIQSITSDLSRTSCLQWDPIRAQSLQTCNLQPIQIKFLTLPCSRHLFSSS